MFSFVPPADITTFLPKRGLFFDKISSVLLKILFISASLPFPVVPQARKPSSGSIIEKPFCFNLLRFSCINLFSHIPVFMQGASIIGFLQAQVILVKRLSQIPFAIFEIVLALIGAITKISAHSQRLICSGL